MRFRLSLLVAAIWLACDDAAKTPSSPDAATTDGGSAGETGTVSDAAAADGGAEGGGGTCPFGTQFQSNGETCVGFGVSSECEAAGSCGRYGYLCINGGPPGITGCTEKSTSAFGNSYCCPTNPCVAQPDQNGACGDAGAGKTKRFQCPPEGGGHATPPGGCVEHTSGGTALERFYCCP
jgi:hypothetical protein